MSTSSGPVTLSITQARRLVLAAQGFTKPRPAKPTRRHLRDVIGHIGLVQVDSVNVLARAHLVPAFSRLGPYDTDLFVGMSSGPDRDLVEYWAHVQALMPVELWPVMRHRMDHHLRTGGKWSSPQQGRALGEAIVRVLGEKGPMSARDAEVAIHGGVQKKAKEHWGWNWSQTRHMLDAMFSQGRVAIAGRNSQFEVLYGLPDQVIPARWLNAHIPTEAEANRELTLRAARSLGVATAAEIADYHRMLTADVRRALGELHEADMVVQASVEGWKQGAWVVAGTSVPRKVHARALLSPFDPLVWHRDRTEALFDFHHRLEIYVPRAQRRWGYYVLPFLLGTRLVARVDLKADRPGRRLLVEAAWKERHAPLDTASELAAELRLMADWLGLEEVVVGPRGDLAPELALEVASHAG